MSTPQKGTRRRGSKKARKQNNPPNQPLESNPMWTPGKLKKPQQSTTSRINIQDDMSDDNEQHLNDLQQELDMAQRLDNLQHTQEEELTAIKRAIRTITTRLVDVEQGAHENEEHLGSMITSTISESMDKLQTMIDGAIRKDQDSVLQTSRQGKDPSPVKNGRPYCRNAVPQEIPKNSQDRTPKDPDSDLTDSTYVKEDISVITDKSPDPPGATTLVKPAAKRHSHCHVTTQPVQTTTRPVQHSTASTATHQVSNCTTTMPPTTVHPTPTVIVKSGKSKKLKLQNYSKNVGFKTWKHTCLLDLSLDDYYSNTVIETTDGTLHFNPNMSRHKAKLLYAITSKALGSNMKEITGNSDKINTEADGFQLWRLAEKHFLKTTSLVLVKKKYKDEFNAIIKEDNEDITKYGYRLQEAYDNLILQGITPPSGNDLAIQIIKGVNQTLALNSLLQDIDKCHVSYEHCSIKDIIDEIEEELQQYVMIHGPHSLKPEKRCNTNEKDTTKKKETEKREMHPEAKKLLKNMKQAAGNKAKALIYELNRKHKV